MMEPVKLPPNVDALARRLPRPGLDADRSAALRDALLDAAHQPASGFGGAPRGRWLGAGAAMAAAVAAVIAWRVLGDRAPAGAEPRIVIRDVGDAPVGSPSVPSEPLPEGVHVIAVRRPTQLVREEATISAPAGAQFQVDVQGGRVRLVTVKAGWVVIAAAHGAPTIVMTQQSWTLAPPAPGPSASTSAPPASPSAPAASKIASSASSPGSLAPPASHPTRGTRDDLAARADRAPAQPAASPAQAAASPAPRPRLPAAPVVESISVAAPANAPADAPAPAPPTAAPVTVPRTTEQDFRDGLKLLLSGSPRGAKAPLERACSAISDSQADICYWAAVAAQRRGDRFRARRGFTEILARWPTSTHVGEAQVALGWLLLEADERGEARTHFAAAVNDRVPGVRAEAVRGLAAAQ